MTIQQPILVLFDLDGTLLGSYPFLLGAHNHVRKSLGHEDLFSMNKFLSMLGRSTHEVYREIYGDRAEEAKACLKRYRREQLVKSVGKDILPMEGATEILSFLKTSGIFMGIVSNVESGLIRPLIQALGWTDFFKDAICGSGDTTGRKPAAEPLYFAAERAGISFDPARVWMVGDTEADVASAKAAGCVSVLVNFRRDCGGIVEKLKPDLVIDRFPELERIFSELSGTQQLVSPGTEILAPK